MKLPIIVIGAGGHGRIVIDALFAGGHDVLGVTDRNAGTLSWSRLCGVDLLGDDRILDSHGPDSVFLANGVGGVATTALRRDVYDRLTGKGYSFPAIQHPSATVSRTAKIEVGAHIMAGAVVQVASQIGMDSIINTGARIDHDCRIGAHVHIGPGAILCGNVTVEDGVSIGAGATIRQGLTISSGAFVGMGAAVVTDVAARTTVVGVPARVRT